MMSKSDSAEIPEDEGTVALEIIVEFDRGGCGV